MVISEVRRNRAQVRQADRWRAPWLEIITSVLVLTGTLIFLYPQVSSWFSQREQSRVTALALERMEKPPHNDAVYRNSQLDEARRYNHALSSGAIYEAHGNIAVGAGFTSDDRFVYEDLLSLGGTGLMARLHYEALKIDLPVYHGTSDKVLAQGVGHLEGTSLPVGGVDTRSVLTAHRGLPESTLFNELDKATVGDRFTITVFGEVLTYEVTDTQVIEPDETEAILPVPGRDVVTLLTCTPLGINTHRILVNAERVTPTPIADVESATALPELPGYPWWALILGGVVVSATVFVWRSGYRVPNRASHPGQGGTRTD